MSPAFYFTVSAIAAVALLMMLPPEAAVVWCAALAFGVPVFAVYVRRIGR